MDPNEILTEIRNLTRIIGYAPAADAPLVGPPNVQSALREEGDGIEIKSSHDGYVARFGVRHE